ncbi:MAG: hypothetical protein O7F70_00845 [Gemmatimonadetes bacterium]|nr:hypothetical protein [Gemmatimonadota bacterium]
MPRCAREKFHVPREKLPTGPTVVKHAQSGVTDHVTYLYVPIRGGPEALAIDRLAARLNGLGLPPQTTQLKCFANVDQV